ncbi:hypothetical protein PCANC_12201 [Puccinia coronata f. sp. avenae]|uniref:Uncharacterized protein n=1 Tax=Puccinia coronata f. sp. avenae TaxID=200324 RepID=A0A2N5VEX1_9BASI|nr:hypothetical protein PCANC_23874 [Puccinia coronata f. sp. avenae]PLW48547.1 hypothetical protein PCANC_12201 [Puccinia coronata f. sp. avenae]
MNLVAIWMDAGTIKTWNNIVLGGPSDGSSSLALFKKRSLHELRGQLLPKAIHPTGCEVESGGLVPPASAGHVWRVARLASGTSGGWHVWRVFPTKVGNVARPAILRVSETFVRAWNPATDFETRLAGGSQKKSKALYGSQERLPVSFQRVVHTLSSGARTHKAGCF